MYNTIKSKIQIFQERLQEKIKENPSGLFWFLKTKLFLNGVLLELAKYYILLFKDPAVSFNLFINQQNLKVCTYSYCNYKYFQKKVRLFSLGGAATIIAVAVIVSLTTNLIFGPWLPTKAATYTFQQTDWNASSTATAIHTTDQSGWDSFYSKDSSVATGTTLQLVR